MVCSFGIGCHFAWFWLLLWARFDGLAETAMPEGSGSVCCRLDHAVAFWIFRYSVLLIGIKIEHYHTSVLCVVRNRRDIRVLIGKMKIPVKMARNSARISYYCSAMPVDKLDKRSCTCYRFGKISVIYIRALNLGTRPSHMVKCPALFPLLYYYYLI